MPDAISAAAGTFSSESEHTSTSYCPSPPPFKLVHHYVPHCKQYFNWDCGLACALMVLRADGAFTCNYQALREMCPTTSIWTVDLAHLLRRFGLDVVFFTITLGPNPAFANESFYMENMQEDEQRVSQLFQDAPKAGIQVQHRSVSASELRGMLLAGGCLVIVLLDKRQLLDQQVPWLMMSPSLPALCGLEPPGYMGHYVVLIGFDTHTQEYIVRDPATGSPEHRLSVHALEQARRSFGTDEDLLVVTSPRIKAQALALRREAKASATEAGA